MKAIIKIQMDNAAFADGDNAPYELARILREAADRLDDGDISGFSLRDANGNTVGELKVTR